MPKPFCHIANSWNIRPEKKTLFNGLKVHSPTIQRLVRQTLWITTFALIRHCCKRQIKEGVMILWYNWTVPNRTDTLNQLDNSDRPMKKLKRSAFHRSFSWCWEWYWLDSYCFYASKRRINREIGYLQWVKNAIRNKDSPVRQSSKRRMKS